MANIFGNISANIPAKARVMIILSLLAVFCIILYAFSGAFGGGKQKMEAAAKIDLPPTAQEISKDSALDKPIFADDSEVGRVYKAAEKKDLEVAEKKDNASHLDALRIRLDAEEATRRAKPVVAKTQEPTDLEKLLAKRAAEQEVRKGQQQASAAQAQASVATQNNPWQIFIDEERKFGKDYATTYGLQIEQLRQKSSIIAKPAYDVSGDSTKSGSYAAASAGVPELSNKGSLGYQRLMAAENQQRGVTTQNVSMGARTSDDGWKTPIEESGQATNYDYPSERLAAQTRGIAKTSENIVVGEIFYAILQIGVNTDEISPIRAVVVEKGKLTDAVLIGKPARVGEKAVLQFEKMSVNGKSTAVNVVALDPDTMRTGIADGVDSHTLERYGKLFAASFIEGFADGLSGGQTTTNTDGSKSTIIDSLPNPADQAMIGLGKVGDRFGPIFEKEFERPPTVTVEPNKTVILMFLEDVDLSKKN
jgi:hypothetical protein